MVILRPNYRDKTKYHYLLKDEERIKYLSKKYFDRTITKEEWEEVLWRLNRAENPESIDQLFKIEWLRKEEPHKISHLSWEDMRRSWKPDPYKNRKVFPYWKWAVAASLLVMISILWLISVDDQNLIAYETGFGETEEIQLNDGTLITLNANSRMIWDAGWENSGLRVVELDGEAYFDVSHKDVVQNGDQKLLPFQVKTADLVVNVLGTAFNVSNRRKETTVYLERGLVNLVLGDGESEEPSALNERSTGTSQDSFGQREVLMKPGESVQFSSETKTLNKSIDDTGKTSLSWKNGTLSFRKMEFGTILLELEDIYGKQFEVEDRTLLDRKVSLAVPFQNWETVYKLIEVILNLEMVESNENNIITIKKRTG